MTPLPIGPTYDTPSVLFAIGTPATVKPGCPASATVRVMAVSPHA
jgi:hypothetical protein